MRSADNGQTWTPIYVSNPGTAQNITAVVVQPDNPAIVYAITSMDRGGVWKSTNSGAAFAPANSGLPAGSLAVQSFTIAVNSPQTLYARVGTQVFRSTNGGQLWSARGNLPTNATAVGFSLNAPARAYTMVDGGQVFRSNDEGATWSLGGLVNPAETGRFAVRFVVDFQDPDIAYVASEVNNSTGRCTLPGGGQWITRDAGASWANIYASDFCNVSGFLTIDARRPIVHISTGFFGRGYCRSTDRGGRFECFNSAAPTGVDPRNGDFIIGSGGRTVSNDAGLSWQPLASTVRPSLPVVPLISLELEQGTSASTVQRFVTPESIAYRLPFRATVASGSWLTLPSPNGTTGTDLRLNFSAAGLTPGTYPGSLRLESPQANNSPVTIPFELRVVPRADSGLRYSISSTVRTDNILSYFTRDASNNLYGYSIVANRIFRITPSNQVSSFLGNGTRGASPNGTTTANLTLDAVWGMAMDRDGSLVLAEGSSLRAIRSGAIQTLIDDTATFGGGNFPIRFGSPRAVAVDSSNRVYVGASPGLVRRLPAGQLELAFTPQATGPRPFYSDLAIAGDGTIFIADSLAHTVYRLRQGQLTVVAGTGTAGFNGDGRAANTAQLSRPSCVDVDQAGNLLICDSGNNRVRAVTADGNIFTVAGGGQTAPAVGIAATEASLSPSDIVIDSEGNVIVVSSLTICRLTAIRTPRPEVSSGAMRNAASGAESVAPGSLFSLYGANFANASTLVGESPWPTTAGGASVLVNGTAVPLYFVSPNQINGQIPFNLAPGPASVQVRNASGSSNPIPFEVAATAPGILQFGENRAVAVNPDGSVNTADNPIAAGGILLVYLTGIGAVDNPVATGAPASASPLSRPTAPFRITAGDQEAEVLYLGLAPGFVGLAQANIRVRNVSGTVPLTVTVGDVTSNSPLISIVE
ncbi:MAG: hypothetical protein JNN08_31705 [Bryobacterales bacterium]|nr:hypothetical protein [Bryobacterales bacterium]